MPATKEKIVSVPPFAIEIDAPRNNDVRIQAIPGCVLRGAIKARAGVRTMDLLPDIPGMQIHIDPPNLSYKIIDPLHGDADLCEQIRRVMEQSSASVYDPGKVLNGCPPLKGTLDEDRMKCLVREALWLLDEDHANMIEGPKPMMEEVEELPGRFLLNPGATVMNGQPTYEDQLEEWRKRLFSHPKED